MWVNIACFLVLIVALVYDIRSYRIPNTWILIGYGIGMMTAILSGGLIGLIQALLRATLPILILYALYVIRVLGAGDVKLLSCISLMCSTQEAIQLIFFSFCIGAVVTVIRLCINGQGVVRLFHFVTYIRYCVQTKQVVPYETFEDASSYLHFSVCILLAYAALTLREVCL